MLKAKKLYELIIRFTSLGICNFRKRKALRPFALFCACRCYKLLGWEFHAPLLFKRKLYWHGERMSNPIRLQEDPGEGESDRRLASSCKAFSGTPVQWTVPSVKVSSSRRCGSLRLRAPVSGAQRKCHTHTSKKAASFEKCVENR